MRVSRVPGFISVKDVDQQVFVQRLSVFLKNTGKVQLPEWTDLVKLSRGNEQAPSDPDWFYVRLASMLRHLYCRASGLNGFAKIYGRKKDNGVAPSHFIKANRCVLRKSLQILEALGLVARGEQGGRILTSQGRRDLDRIAYQVQGGRKQPVAS